MAVRKSAPTQQQALKAQAADAREKLATNLESLVHVAQPKTQATYLAENVKYRVEDVTYRVGTTVEEALEGDQDAVRKVAVASGIGLGTLLLLRLRRKWRKKH